MFILVFIAVFSNCNQAEKKNENSTPTQIQQIVRTTITDSCNNYDSLLSEYAESFKATTVNLEASISAELRNFLNTIDTNCLRQQKQYKLFIATVLAKLYVYHIHYGEVGYDLLGMKTGAAKIIINEFQGLAGYKVKRLEFLNSGMVVSYIRQDRELRANKTLQKLVKKFK